MHSKALHNLCYEMEPQIRGPFGEIVLLVDDQLWNPVVAMLRFDVLDGSHSTPNSLRACYRL